jgi:hypothetical protein
MRVAEGFEESLAAKFAVLFPHLDERQRRLLMGPRPGRWVMAGSGWWPGPPGSGRRRWRWASRSWTPVRSRWAGPAGWVNVGTDGDTAAFAVESIRRWWQAAGAFAYPGAARLLITADAGGSNGYRTRAWKAELAALAAQTGLDITVCHFPPGTQCRCLSY